MVSLFTHHEYDKMTSAIVAESTRAITDSFLKEEGEGSVDERISILAKRIAEETKRVLTNLEKMVAFRDEDSEAGRLNLLRTWEGFEKFDPLQQFEILEIAVKKEEVAFVPAG